MSQIPVGPDPIHIKCPFCHVEIITTLKMEENVRTHVIALLFCSFCCWRCVSVPYCMDSCRNKNHYCPNCNAFIGFITVNYI